MVQTKQVGDTISKKMVPRRRRRPRQVLSRRQKAEVARIAKNVDDRGREMKYYDSNAATNMVNAGTVVHLSGIPQTDGVSGRDGDSVHPKFLALRGIVKAATTASNFQEYRISLIQWKPNTADTVPTTSRLYEIFLAPFSYMNRDYTKQYRVLWSSVGSVTKDIANPDSTAFFDFSIPESKLKEITFNDSATYGENQLYLVMHSDQVSDAPDFDWVTRLGYTDS